MLLGREALTRTRLTPAVPLPLPPCFPPLEHHGRSSLLVFPTLGPHSCLRCHPQLVTHKQPLQHCPSVAVFQAASKSLRDYTLLERDPCSTWAKGVFDPLKRHS